SSAFARFTQQSRPRRKSLQRSTVRLCEEFRYILSPPNVAARDEFTLVLKGKS
ncbi:hypothetical protein ABIB38_004813, partial [Massilia sp. UYP11]